MIASNFQEYVGVSGLQDIDRHCKGSLTLWLVHVVGLYTSCVLIEYSIKGTSHRSLSRFILSLGKCQGSHCFDCIK